METLTESLVSFVLWGGLLFGSKNGVECIFFKPKGYYLLFTLKKNGGYASSLSSVEEQ